MVDSQLKNKLFELINNSNPPNNIFIINPFKYLNQKLI